MKKETIEEYEIKYKKYIFSKSIRVSLSSAKSVLVTMPYFCPYKTARDFLLSNFEKIKSFKCTKKSYSNEFKKEAKKYLVERTRYLADIYGFKIGRIAIRNQKTRFGSCSFKNNINLNMNLMEHDKEVRDYVILHELVHTKIKNHSSAFWLEVEKYCPNYKILKSKLKS